jgi:paraquat-inducible protein B
MRILRRLLGVFVMIAGIVGLLLSLAGLVGLWMVKPTVTASADATLTTLLSSVVVSQETLVTTNEALGATVASLEALSEMLNTTAKTVEDTQPVIVQINVLMGEALPVTLEAAAESLMAAESAAESLEVAIQAFDAFRLALGSAPLLSAVVPAPEQTYDPAAPLSESLGELSESIQAIPAMLSDLAVGVDEAGGNLDLIEGNLDTMAESVTLISVGLSRYQVTITESRTSMDDLESLLTEVQTNLSRILNVATLIVALLLVWLLAAQVVILSQGWELYRGTAGAMAGGVKKSGAVADAPSEE